MWKRIGTFVLVMVFFFGIPEASATEAMSELSCSSAVLMEKETGTILYEKKAHEKLQPASVTKVMTLLLVMEALDEGRMAKEDLVSISAYASGMGGSQVYLKEGEQMTVHELIKCVAVVSGNDCAVALAEHLEGSETTFVSRMNQRAKELGMEDTTFVNCTGLPAQGHITSAHDIALMSRELILNHPGIREYTTIWMDTIREGTFGLTNTNRLIRFYPGATGLKTGSTNGALYCMSATAERDGMELIAVVMKAPTTAQRFEDAKALLDYGFSSYVLKEIYPDAPLPSIPVLLGTVSHVQPELARSCRLLLEKGEAGSVTTSLALAQDLQAPVENRQILGSLDVYVGDELRDSVPIVAAQEVPRLSFVAIFVKLMQTLTMAG